MSPKTITGEELELDDAPARDCELFLVDGNNLAYRAFFALPEELQTTDGQPSGALLGFTNMLFKLLADYAPRGVAVAWDTRPVHRTEISADYKSERRPMPDLLREQFPHFRPIEEASLLLGRQAVLHVLVLEDVVQRPAPVVLAHDVPRNVLLRGPPREEEREHVLERRHEKRLYPGA